ncbi:MAG: hypothetical protein JJE19_04515 [Methanosarcinales archaeon]|nr:hypothetical protein [Methanosarcinales archaeon]
MFLDEGERWEITDRFQLVQGDVPPIPEAPPGVLMVIGLAAMATYLRLQKKRQKTK